VPLGGQGFVPLVLPLLLAWAGWGVVRGVLGPDPHRLVLVTAALATCGASALWHLTREPDASLFSYLFLVTLYLPLALVLRRPGRLVVERLLDRFELVMAAAAAVALVQIGTQVAGLAYTDLLAEVVPSSLLVPGYNTSYPITFGSEIYKANAYLFLEPSFLSQFLGMAVVVRLARGRAGWRVLLYAAGLAATVAGTGIVLAAVGALLVLGTRHARSVLVFVPPLAVVAAVVAVTPLGGILLERATEVTNEDSSASLRFVQPFQVLGGAWLRDLQSLLLGNGPGSSERYVTGLTGSTTLQQPVPLKLVFDYGGIAAALFLLAVVVCVLWRPPVPPLAGALLVAYLLLSSALLQPVTVLTVWLLTSALSAVPQSGGPDPGPPGRPPLEPTHRRVPAPVPE
jgi:hypothetical protein